MSLYRAAVLISIHLFVNIYIQTQICICFNTCRGSDNLWWWLSLLDRLVMEWVKVVTHLGHVGCAVVPGTNILLWHIASIILVISHIWLDKRLFTLSYSLRPLIARSIRSPHLRGRAKVLLNICMVKLSMIHNCSRILYTPVSIIWGGVTKTWFGHVVSTNGVALTSQYFLRW